MLCRTTSQCQNSIKQDSRNITSLCTHQLRFWTTREKQWWSQMMIKTYSKISLMVIRVHFSTVIWKLQHIKFQKLPLSNLSNKVTIFLNNTTDIDQIFMSCYSKSTLLSFIGNWKKSFGQFSREYHLMSILLNNIFNVYTIIANIYFSIVIDEYFQSVDCTFTIWICDMKG